MVFKCCVSKCGYTNKDQKMHVFPREFQLVQKWCEAIGREDLLKKEITTIRKSYRVCDYHFHESAKFLDNRNRSNLKHGSIPSVHLPVVVSTYVLCHPATSPDPLTMDNSMADTSEIASKKIKIEIKEENKIEVDVHTEIKPEEVMIKEELIEDECLASVKTQTSTELNTDIKIETEKVNVKEEKIEGEMSTASVATQTNIETNEILQLIIDRYMPKRCKQALKGPKLAARESDIFQFKVTLVRGRGAPEIWRRFQVPGNYTFRQLHVAIQKSMGWKSIDFDYHLHAFKILNPDTNLKDSILMRDDFEAYDGVSSGSVKDEEITKIIDYFKIRGLTARYEYDFGAGWEHELVFEDVFFPKAGETYPVCIAGEKACPPEDGVVDSDEEYDSDEFDASSCF